MVDDADDKPGFAPFSAPVASDLAEGAASVRMLPRLSEEEQEGYRQRLRLDREEAAKVFAKTAPLTDPAAERDTLHTACILAGEAQIVRAWLLPEHFYDARNARLWSAILSMLDDGLAPDLFSARERCGVDEDHVHRLCYYGQWRASLEAPASVVYEWWQARMLKAAGARLSTSADDAPTSGAAIEGMQAQIAKLDIGQRPQRAASSLARAPFILAHLNGEGRERCVPTGLQSLDEVLNGGLYAGNLVIIGARPGVGKTAFALNMALYQALGGGKVLIFSLEMEKLELDLRLLATRTGVPLKAITSRTLSRWEYEQCRAATNELSMLPIHVDDAGRTTVEAIASESRMHATEGDLSLIIVDYLQLVRAVGKHYSRETELASISATLKALAKELKCAVVALAQLNRGVEAADDPGLHHLRESGSLEQDADKVLFLWTPDPDIRSRVQVKVAKHRAGECGRVELRWYGATQRFVDEGQ